MKSKFKKPTAWLLTLAMLFMMLPGFTFTALAVETDDLCAHHAEHTADCGYTEDGSECTFVCQVCAVQALIDALPDDVTAENADAVANQLSAIDTAKAALSDEELAQVDFSRYTAAVSGISALSGQPGANTPVAASLSITVQIEGGNSYTLDVPTSDRIEDVKAHISAITNISLSKLELYFNNNKLDDNSTVEACGIQNGSTLTAKIIAYANPRVYIEYGSITLSVSDGATYYQQGSDAAVPYTGEITIAGTSDANSITVQSGTHDVVISNLTISAAAPFDITAGATVNLYLDGTNNLTATAAENAGLHVPSGATLNIYEKSGGGSLTAIGNTRSAGIGSRNSNSSTTDVGSGKITINGGTVTAVGADGGAGIGGACYCSATDIQINGGIISASSGQTVLSSGGAGIGGGGGGKTATIAFTGGYIVATGDGAAAGIGTSGMNGTATITISGGTIIANGGSSAQADIGYGRSSGSTATTIITGGNIKANVIANPVAAQGGASVSLQTVDIPDGYDISKLSITDSAGKYNYGLNDVQPIDGKVYLYLPTGVTASTECPHTTVSYIADGNVITASCSANCGYGGTASISATGKNYDGTAVEIIVTKTGSLENTDVPVTLTKDGATLDSAPVNAGDYTASISLGEGENAVTASVDFTIAQIMPNYTVPTLNATYGQTLSDLMLESRNHGTPGTWTWDNVDPDTTSVGNVGENLFAVTLTPDDAVNYMTINANACVTVSPTDQYTENVTGNQNVIRESGEFREPTYTDINNELLGGKLVFTYDGDNYDYSELVEKLKTLQPDTTASVGYTFTPDDNNYTSKTGTLNFTVCTVKFTVNGEPATAENAIVRNGTPTYGERLEDRITISSVLTANLTSTTDTAPHNFSLSTSGILPVGTHTIQLLYNGTLRGITYENVVVCEFTVTVNKAASSITKAPEAISGLKFQEANGKEVQQNLVTAGEAAGGKMVYRISSDGEWSQDIPPAGQVRDYTVYYKVLGDSNHNDSAEGQVNVSIVKADAPTVTIPVQEHFYTIPTAENRIDIKSLLPKLCGIINEESEVTGTTGDFIENAAFNNGVLSYDTKTGTLGATGTITVKIVMRNYEDVTVTVNVELIDLNPVSNSGTDDEIKYDGSTYDVAQMFSKDTNAGEASYEISGGSGAGELNGSVLTITKAGTIQIKLTTAAQGDYAAGEATATLTVKKADGAGSVTMDDWTYGETAKTPTTENGTGTAIFLYTGSGYSSANVPTDAGTYTVTATFVENDLYEAATASDTFVIAQKELIPSISGNVSKTYDGTTTVPDGLSIMLDGIVIGDNISATASYAYDGADAGTTKINATNITLGGADAGNYTLKSTTASADVGEITKADPIYEVPAAATLTYNGGEQTLLTGGSVMGGKFQYSLDNQNWSDTIPIGKNAENYTVYFKVVGDSNHNDNAGDSVPVTITKQDVTITAKDQTIVYGQTISQTEIISSGLVDGHSVTVTLTPSTTILTENGTITASNAVISVNGTDVTANYEISYEDGKLVITFDTSGIDALDPETVTSDDRETLEEALDTIEALLEEDLTEEQKKTLEDVKTDVEALIERIEAAQDALDTENTEKVEDVTTDNVKPEDKDALEKAKTDLEKALEDHSSNYTEEEKQAIQDEIQRIEDALDVIGNVEAVEELIDKLPGTIKKDDEAAIKAADDAYNALTDEEKALVDPDAKKALDDAKAALEELKKPVTDPDSPQTGDNSNLWLWWFLMIVSCGAIVVLVVSNRKKLITK